jgi:hypothetical protein
MGCNETTTTKENTMFDFHYTVPNNLMRMLQSNPSITIVTPQFLALWHSKLEVAILVPGEFTGTQNKKYWELYKEIELQKLNVALPA